MLYSQFNFLVSAVLLTSYSKVTCGIKKEGSFVSLSQREGELKRTKVYFLQNKILTKNETGQALHKEDATSLIKNWVSHKFYANLRQKRGHNMCKNKFKDSSPASGYRSLSIRNFLHTWGFKLIFNWGQMMSFFWNWTFQADIARLEIGRKLIRSFRKTNGAIKIGFTSLSLN